MAITISGENNNDRILAADGVIDQLSGINIAGIVTATTFYGNLIGNVTGNVTGNVNSTSPLLLQTGGSERFRITGNNELGIAGANYGTAGQVLTSGGSGSAVTWSAIPTQITINNNAANRIITGEGGTTLNGEANFTYNGTQVDIAGTTDGVLNLDTTDGRGAFIRFGQGGSYHNMIGCADGLVAGPDKEDLGLRAKDNMVFCTGGANERFRVTGDGPHLLLGGTSDVNEITETSSDAGIVIGNTSMGNGGLAIINSTSGTGRIYFGDNIGSNTARNRGQINYYHSSDYMMFATAGTERLRIDSSGQITNTGIATSFVTTMFAANFAKLDIRGTNIANSNHYLLSYGEGHANDHEFHMVNTLGEIVFRTGTGSNTDRLRIDTSGRISNNSREATDFGSPNLLISGTNSMFTMMGDGSINNSSYTGIKFRVAGGSTGDYTKAGIFVVRQGGYNDLDMLFCFNTDANATGVSDGNEKVRITSDGKIGIGDNDPVVQLHVKGSGHSHAGLNVHTSIEDTTSYAANVGGLQVFEGYYNSANSPAVFSAIHGGKENATDGNYGGYLRFLTRTHGSLPAERVRITSTGLMGVKTPNPQTELNVIGTISTGRNVARELGTIINVSSNHDAYRVGANVINGVKEYEVGADWLAQGNARVNANLTIELPQAYTCDRFVIYNQNEYNNSRREVKNFTLEGSNDNSNWTTILDDDCGASNAHEPNPGFSFRMPASYNDDEEGVTYRYWRFTMKTFHDSDPYGGIMELELYQHHNSAAARSETTTHSLNATDMAAETLQGIKRLYATKGMNIMTGGLTDTWEITETAFNTNGSYYDKSTIRHKRGVMAVSSFYNTGDLFIRIDNLYNLPGNAWWVCGVLILSNEIQGGQGGGHHYVTSLQLMGLSQWSSVSKQDIVGNMTVSMSNYGSNFCELFVNVNDSSRGPCTVICNGGTFDPPRLSFH